MSGVFYIGLGDQFDGDKVKVFPPGCAAGNTSHFHWAKFGGYITQATAIGPLGLEYLDPTDDPRWSAIRRLPAGRNAGFRCIKVPALNLIPILMPSGLIRK